MDNGDLVMKILKSPEAQRMRRMVSSGFYDGSRIGLWLFEVIGREYDEMAEWVRDIRFEAFPQTSTWSLPIWEWLYGISPDDTLPEEYRRGRILSKKLQKPPINPARIEAIISALTGAPVTVTENIAPYTFKVQVDESGGITYDYRAAIRTLREIKPSHLSFRYESRITAEFTAADYCGAAESELLREYFIEEMYIEETAFVYDGGAVCEVMREFVSEERMLMECAFVYDGGAVCEVAREFISEERALEESVFTYGGAAVSEVARCTQKKLGGS